MAIDVTLENVGGGYNRSVINDNFTAIVAALQTALAEGGDIDLDGNDILNGGNGNFESITLDGETFVSSTNSKGDAGWAPKFAIVNDSARRVLKLTGYVGGEGTAPTDHLGEYVGATQMEALIANGVDIRGPVGEGGGDVVGPDESVAGKVVTFANTTGKLLQDSGVTLGTIATRNLTVSTSDPSGGSDGDIWFKIEA